MQQHISSDIEVSSIALDEILIENSTKHRSTYRAAKQIVSLPIPRQV